MPAAGIIYMAGDKFLLLKRQPATKNGSTWCFPAGGIEAGENASTAAAREFSEETGGIAPTNLSEVYNRGGFTLYRGEGPEFAPILNDEHTEFAWVTRNNLPLPLHPGMAEQIGCLGMDSARHIDINDFLTVKRNPISRAGVFQYLGSSIGGDADPNQVYNVYRPASTLSDPEAIESFKLIPIIDDHTMLGPREKGMTPAEEKGQHGTTGEQVEFDPETKILYSNLRVPSEAMKREIEDGKIDLSLGYRCAYKKSSGFFEGMPYHYIQTDMRGNHLALVDEARCNVAVLDHRFTYDSRDAVSIKTGDTMADDKEPKEAEMKDKETSLEDVHSFIKKNAPMWDKIKEMMTPAEEAKKEDISPSGSISADGDMDDEGEGEDADEPKKDDEKGKGMDKAQVTRIAQDEAQKLFSPKAFFAAAAERDQLVNAVKPFVGVFDAADKTVDEVAAYALKKLGITVKAGDERATLNGFIARNANAHVGLALDSVTKTAAKGSAFDKLEAYAQA